MSLQVSQTLPMGMPQSGFAGRDTVPIFAATGSLAVTQTAQKVTYSVTALALTLQAVQSSNFTAVAGNLYPVDTTGGAVTVLLPAAATVGDTIQFMKFGTNACTFSLNGLKWFGLTSNQVTTAEGIEQIQYTGATRGWIDL